MTKIKRIQEIIPTCRDIFHRTGMENELIQIDELIANAKTPSFNLLVCGEFKRGKSSLINALLNENVCPVDIGVTTAVVSIIRYGDIPKVIRHYGNILQQDNNSEQRSKIEKEVITFDSIEEYVKCSSIDISNTIMLEIEIPNERLKSGLCVIDTPGVGSMDPRHLFLTLYALPNADAIIFMTAAGEPFSSTERDFFTNHIAPLNIPSCILINKSDMFASTEEENLYVEDTQKKLVEAKVENSLVIPVSAQKWAKYNAKKDERSRKSSNCDSITGFIAQALTCKTEYINSTVLVNCTKIIEDLGNSLQAKLNILQNPALTDEEQSLLSELERLKTLQKEMLDDQSQLRTKIRDIFNKTQRNALKQISQESILLSSEKLDNLLEKEIQNNKDWKKGIVVSVQKEISRIGEEMGKMMIKASNDISKDINKEIKFYYNPCDTEINANNITKKSKRVDEVYGVIRNIMPGLTTCGLTSTLGGTAAALVGSTLITSLGAVAGFGLGAYVVVNGILSLRKKEKIMQVKHSLSPHITNAMNDLRHHVQEQFDELNKQIYQTLKLSADQLKTQIEDTQKLIQDSKGDDKVRQQNIVRTQKDLTYIIYVMNKLKSM